MEGPCGARRLPGNIPGRCGGKKKTAPVPTGGGRPRPRPHRPRSLPPRPAAARTPPPAPPLPHRVGGPRQRRAVQALSRGRAHAHRPARRARAQRSGPGSGPAAATAGSHRLEARPRRHLLQHKGERTGTGALT